MAFLPTASSLPSDFGIFKNPGLCFPVSHGCNSIKSRFDGPMVHDLSTTRCKGPFLGTPRFLRPSMGHGFYLSKICVAAYPSYRLSPADVARTTVEANNRALLMFRGMVPHELHQEVSWDVLQFGIDDSGDISFIIYDDGEPLKHNWVSAFFGTDIKYFNKRNSESTIFAEIPYEWNRLSNVLLILGYLRPINVDKHFGANLIRYQLVIEKMELHTLYESQAYFEVKKSEISVAEFRNAKPDILVHSATEIVNLINRTFSGALEDFCKKKGLGDEGARVIGVDSLGMDVRVLKGGEVKIHSIPFKAAQATSREEAVKLILQLLFPKNWRLATSFYFHYIE